MTTEQREAIEAVEEFNNKFDCGKYRKSIDTVLSLIKEQQKKIEGLKNIDKNQSKDIKKAVDYTFELNKEIEKKDKQIDLMAKYWNAGLAMCENCEKIVGNYDENKCKNCIKQYFEREVEDEK